MSSCGYGEKYHGLRRCRPSSMHSMFFIRVTMSSWLRSDTRLPVMRGADGMPSELSWESSSVPKQFDFRFRPGCAATALRADPFWGNTEAGAVSLGTGVAGDTTSTFRFTSLSGDPGRDPGSPFLVGVLASFLGNWIFFRSSRSWVTHSSRRLLKSM